MGCKACQKPKVQYRKGLWSPEEDQKLRDFILRYGHGCWSTVPVKAGLQRNGKSCRLRWINYLRPGLKHGMFSREEEETVMNLKKRVEGAQAAARKSAEPADVTGSPVHSEAGQERAATDRPASSDSSGPVESSSADDSSCLTEPAAGLAAVRPHAPVIPKVMFADWFDMDYGTNLAGTVPGLDAVGGSPAQGLSYQGSSSVQVDGPCGAAVDSLHGLGDGGFCWDFDDAADHMQGGGELCDLLSMSEFLGIN